MKTRVTRIISSFLIVFSLLLCCTTRITANALSFTEQNNNEYNCTNNKLSVEYKRLVKYAKEHEIPLKLDFEQFLEEYNNTGAKNVDEYVNLYYNLLETESDDEFNPSSNKGNPFAWQYNTGLSLPRDPNYSKYNLLEVCKPGDIIYEANGGFGITGHIAMVEGKFYDEARGKYYIRVIEAIQNGVVRGVLDDDRVDMQKSYVYRVKDATEDMAQKAVQFEISQLGKPYILDFRKHTSPDTWAWYCSELAWASYMIQGINLETQSYFNEPGVTPRDMVRSGMMNLIDINIDK